MISIIIPLYNQSKALDKCLESIKNQTIDNYEIIVVNDRSTEPLSWLIKKYKNIFSYKISFIHNQENHGAPYARNKGFKFSHGEYLLFCDADLLLTPSALEIMLKTLKKQVSASYVYPSHKYGHKLFKLWPFDADKLRLMPYIHSTALIRREHYPRSGWDESLKRLQDWDLFLTMLDEGHEGLWIDQVLFKIKPGGVYSNWLPSSIYKLLPFLPKVRAYKNAVVKVKRKHFN